MEKELDEEKKMELKKVQKLKTQVQLYKGFLKGRVSPESKDVVYVVDGIGEGVRKIDVSEEKDEFAKTNKLWE